MNPETIWLLQLISAHLLTDFVLQPDSWVKSKREKKLKSHELWYHALLGALFSVLFTGFHGWWWVAPIVFVSHLAIDWWKTSRRDTLSVFAVDQGFHLLIIIILWKIAFPEVIFISKLSPVISGKDFWMVVAAAIFLSKPVSVVVGMITRPFREKIERFSEQTLEKAGTWIGILERLIIFFLVLVGQWDAIGLLVAAKSIIRLKDGDQKMSEYVLIGTLISISIAIITGFVVSSLF